MSLMYDKCIFGQRLTELRKKRWEQYKENQNIVNNPYEKFACCKTQETLAEAIGVERRTIGKWELGTSIPTIDKVAMLCNLFECNIDYLLGSEELIGFSPSVIASHYSGISVDIINYGQVNADYLDCLNHFMHPTNCSSLFNSITLTAWKDFLSQNELEEITNPLKSLIIDTFQKYQTFTPLNDYNKETYRQCILTALPPKKISFSPRKLDESICVNSCISNTRFNSLGLSDKNPESYNLFIEYIVEYSFKILTTKVLLDIQKESLAKAFVRMFEKYVSEE